MRSPIQKELITCFKQEFEPRFPQFKRSESATQSLIWEWKYGPNLTFFILLQPFSRYDQFTVEVAWSEDSEFPWPSLGKAKIEGAQGRVRLSRLWSAAVEAPIWDVAPEEIAAVQADLERLGRGEPQLYPPDPPVELILPRVRPLVRDAVEKLIQYGVPLFRRVAEHRGLNWPIEARVIA